MCFPLLSFLAAPSELLGFICVHAHVHVHGLQPSVSWLAAVGKSVPPGPVAGNASMHASLLLLSSCHF